MGNVLQRVRTQCAGFLIEDERFFAAGVGRTIAGAPGADQLPPYSIWAATQRRLLVWTTEGRTAMQVGVLVVEFELGTNVNRATLEPYRGYDAKMTVFANGHPAVVVMDTADARSIAQAIGMVAAAAPPPSTAPPPPPPQRSEPTIGVIPVDPTLGDDRINEVNDGLIRGDWQPAQAIFAEADPGFRELLTCRIVGEAARPALDEWVGEHPSSSDAYLARGSSGVAWAWEGQPGPTVGGRPDPTFAARLRDADRDLLRSVELDFADPTAWTPLLRSARGLQIPIEEVCMRYDESVRRHPGLLQANLQIQESLSRRWFGSHEEMFAFARTTARAAPEGSPLHALIPMAHIQRSLDPDPNDDPRRKYFTADVAREVELFADLSVDHGAWVDDATTVPALNIFAMAFSKCGLGARTHSLMSRIGLRRSFLPWSVCPDGDGEFRQAKLAE